MEISRIITAGSEPVLRSQLKESTDQIGSSVTSTLSKYRRVEHHSNISSRREFFNNSGHFWEKKTPSLRNKNENCTNLVDISIGRSHFHQWDQLFLDTCFTVSGYQFARHEVRLHFRIVPVKMLHRIWKLKSSAKYSIGNLW